MKFWHYL